MWSSICLEISRRNSWYWHELSFYQNKWSAGEGGWVRQTNCIQIRNHECKIEMNIECLKDVRPQSVSTFLVLSSDKSVNINDIRYSPFLKAILDTTLFCGEEKFLISLIWFEIKDLPHWLSHWATLSKRVDSREFLLLRMGLNYTRDQKFYLDLTYMCPFCAFN